MNMEEILKAVGIEDAKAAEVLAAMRENGVFTAGQENLDVRYGKLKDEHTGKLAELDKANELIAELQKTNKGNEALQGKVAGYQSEVEALQKELAATKLDAAIKVGLLAEKALDVDYLAFKLRESGDLSLDENGDVKGWADKVAGLRTQFPTQFEGAKSKNVVENPLDQADDGKKRGVTRSDILKMPYNQRAELFEKDPAAYREAMGQD